MAFQEYYDFRRKLVDALTTDLVGPSAADEIITDPPTTRYISGILYPQSSDTIDPVQDIDVADGEDEAVTPDPPVALANRRYPSSMGMTFAVDRHNTNMVEVHLHAAKYEMLQPEPNQPLGGASESQRWRRRALTLAPVELDITKPVADKRVSLADGLELFCRIRPADGKGIIPVTLVLLNRFESGKDMAEREARSFFQPSISVSSSAQNAPFVERPSVSVTGQDADIRTFRLLYGYTSEFAVGHGCSVLWQTAANDSTHAESVTTTFTPEYDLWVSDSNPEIVSPALGMRYLAQETRPKCIDGLRSLCDGYAAWIKGENDKVESLPSAELRQTALEHLDGCRDALRRMRLGIDVLASDNVAWDAFCFANAAMLQQRARSEWLRNRKPPLKPEETDAFAWRPFQLAFILQCLEGIANPKSSDRDFADLLWFPTGGGKTEAYLGLIAFTVFLRRLRRGKTGGGVTALMRYTLRLLTIQQFERAALLICCCENIRRANAKFGDDPISIGLWVGQDSTPNKRDQAKSALNQLNHNAVVNKHNPVQLFSCPWCGKALDHRNYWMQTEPPKLVISCQNKDCAFGKGLPVYVVDEDLYDYRPTLIIATADKFASLPWREQAAHLFNIGTGLTPARPELIIQDELHLISGPLGTLAGLYETAVDVLCTQDGIRPKVIASTATVRRAQAQTRALFNRDVRQFPPPGLDARNSYFAVRVGPDQRGTRLYVGLNAPGTSQTTLLVRAFSSLLQQVTEIPAPDRIKDPYWTLVGYFNSLRVLGGARMQVQDDVDDRMVLLAGQSGLDKRPLENALVELTSREDSSKIPAHLSAMSVSYDSAQKPPEAVDVILATNMISVGVDINRLGLMVVMGQPQSTSEYIQSTSRVGRQYPGLVVVLFNAARSRDRSHYESFVAYHSALYRQVEASSVTPFSARARDRGLHAVFVALARLLIPALLPNEGAAKAGQKQKELEPVKQLILRRIAEIAPQELDGARKQLDEIESDWIRRAETVDNLLYWDTKHPERGLLGYAGADTDDQFNTLWSLRDVDKESILQPTSLG